MTPPPKGPWKALERRHPKRFLGGVRLWRKDFGDSEPDGEAPTEVWDTKCFATFSVVALFVECEKKYREFTGSRNFHLCLFSRRHPRAGDFVLVRAARYARLVQIERDCGAADEQPLLSEQKGTASWNTHPS